MSQHLYEKYVNAAIWELLLALDAEGYAERSTARAEAATDPNDAGYYLVKARTWREDAAGHRARAGAYSTQAAKASSSTPLETDAYLEAKRVYDHGVAVLSRHRLRGSPAGVLDEFARQVEACRQRLEAVTVYG